MTEQLEVFGHKTASEHPAWCLLLRVTHLSQQQETSIPFDGFPAISLFKLLIPLSGDAVEHRKGEV